LAHALALTLVFVWQIGGQAEVDPNAQDAAMQAYQRAVAAYKDGDYERAIEQFQASYALSADPELLFNIAQTYRRKPGGCPQAVQFFREYQRLQPAKAASVQPLVDAAAACAVTSPPAPAAPAPAAPTGPSADAARPTPRDASGESTPGRGWKYVLAGGAASVVAGTLLVWSVDWDDGCRPRCSPSQVDGLRLRLDLGYALWAAGGAASGVGLGLWWHGSRHRDAQVRLEAAGNGLWLRGRF
jgi:tetratricopeptide (TPR) repeat protein